MQQRVAQRAQRSEQYTLLKDLEKKRLRLKDEIVNAVMGTSEFDATTLKEALQSIEQKICSIKNTFEETTPLIGTSVQQMVAIDQLKPIVVKWETTFHQCSNDEKKMLMARLIDRITIDRYYNIDIHFRISIEEFYGITPDPHDNATLSKEG